MQNFESILDKVCEILREEARFTRFESSDAFELRVREVLQSFMEDSDTPVDFQPHPHLFPDIVLGHRGIEVKFTAKDTWRIVANSVFESTRSPSTTEVYALFGKMGGRPDVRWSRYDDCVLHVRTSHVPRFELEIGAKESLFKKIGVPYASFAKLDDHEKMRHIRNYARGRLKQGERLWWLEDSPADATHSLPIQARLYTSLEQNEKRRLRAEAALLCPEIVKPSRSKHKYDDVTLYLLTVHGVLCSQVRDLFSAGSVALRADSKRGGSYLLRALSDIEPEMRKAADELDDRLFEEYWGKACPKTQRLSEWLKRADSLAQEWVPSEHLFRD
ncbi:MAG: restriction endonuclease [Puniceicoccaceae bacterium]